MAERDDVERGAELLRAAPGLASAPFSSEGCDDPASEVIREVVLSNPLPAFVPVLAEIMPNLLPGARLTAVHALGRIGTAEAIELQLSTLERYLPDGLSYPGWGNPLWDLEVRPVHGELVFPRLLLLRDAVPWLTPLVDWVTVAYLLEGEVAAETLAGVRGAGEALVRRTQSYRKAAAPKERRPVVAGKPPWFEHPRHQEARGQVFAVIEAMGAVGGRSVRAELQRLAASSDPRVRTAAQSSLRRLGGERRA